MEAEAEKKYSLFLVDDDQFLLNMYSHKFKGSGFEVTTASSSQAALTRLREGFVPDILILDIIMPGLDGLELLGTIRKEKLVENSVIVMLTNQGDESERAKELGVDGYIVKATTVPSEVVATIRKIADSKKR